MGQTHTLRPGYSAFVHTKREQVVNTLNGPVKQGVIEFVEPGKDLPKDLADGELERLEGLGAFEPIPPIELRVAGVIDRNPALLLATAPEGEAVATPSDIRVPTEDEADALERLAEAREDVRRARAEAEDEHAEATGLPPAVPSEGHSTAGAPTVPHVPVEEAKKTTPKKATPAKKTAKKASGTKKTGGSIHGR